jgi:hypothetical protein
MADGASIQIVIAVMVQGYEFVWTFLDVVLMCSISFFTYQIFQRRSRQSLDFGGQAYHGIQWLRKTQDIGSLASSAWLYLRTSVGFNIFFTRP